MECVLVLTLRGLNWPSELKAYRMSTWKDLSNKCPQTLQYNPVHKKITVLVHNAKALAESYIILEYIDKTWKHASRLLPDDPYERAQIRFWASFINQQLFEAMRKMLTSEGEAQVKAIEEVFEKMDVLEKGMKELISGGDSRTVGVKLMDPGRYPFMFSWVQKLNELPVVKEVLPSHGKLVAFLQFIKQNGPIRPSN